MWATSVPLAAAFGVGQRPAEVWACTWGFGEEAWQGGSGQRVTVDLSRRGMKSCVKGASF